MKLSTEKVKQILDRLNKGEEVDNETLFWALRFCERKTNRFPRAWHWMRRVILLKDQIVNQNPGLIGQFVEAAWCPGIDEDELQSELNLALTRAIDGFEPKRGNCWSTYATWVLRRASWKGHKLGTNHLKHLPLTEFCDPIMDEHVKPHPEIHLLSKAWNSARLDDREKYVVYGRYLCQSKKTLSQLAKEINRSKERVRQIEVNALNKLRDAFEDARKEELVLVG